MKGFVPSAGLATGGQSVLLQIDFFEVFPAILFEGDPVHASLHIPQCVESREFPKSRETAQMVDPSDIGTCFHGSIASIPRRFRSDSMPKIRFLTEMSR